MSTLNIKEIQSREEELHISQKMNSQKNFSNYTVVKNDSNSSQNPSEFFKNDFFNNDFFNNDFFKSAMNGHLNQTLNAIPNKNKSVTTTVTNGKNGKTVTNVVQVYHNIQNNNIHNNITNNITINISLKGLFTDEEIYEYMREQEERERREEEIKRLIQEREKEEKRLEREAKRRAKQQNM